jgi:hypothetical protein
MDFFSRGMAEIGGRNAAQAAGMMGDPVALVYDTIGNIAIIWT